MSLTPLQEALWANDIQRLCLLEAGDDVEAGLAAAEYILSTQPVPGDFALSTDAQGHEHRGKGPHGGEFTGKGSGSSNVNQSKIVVDDARIGQVAHRDHHVKVIKLAKAKFRKLPRPSQEEVSENVAGMRAKGVNNFRRVLRGNSADRKKRRNQLLKDFGDGKVCPCVYCGVYISHGTMEQDKMYTTAQGGRYRVNNLIPSCGDCNKRRGDMPFADAIKKVVKYVKAGTSGGRDAGQGANLSVGGVRPGSGGSDRGTGDSPFPVRGLAPVLGGWYPSGPDDGGRDWRGAILAHDIHNPRAQKVLDRTLKFADGMTVDAKRDLTRALRAQGEDGGAAILRFIDKYRLLLARLLTATQLAALLEGMREVAVGIPTVATFPGAVPPPPTMEPEDALAMVERLGDMTADERAAELYKLPAPEQLYVYQSLAAKEAIGSGDGPPAPPFELVEPDKDDPEAVHFPTIDEAVRELASKNVLTRERFDALNAAARAKAFTVAGIDAEETLTKIRDALAQNVAQGADYAAFKQEVMAAVDEGTFLSDGHMETVFRTNIQSALSDGQAAVLAHPVVRSGFPYSAYNAIHDERVRDNHLALETYGIQGTNIYRTDDPVFQLFRPPWDYNDRCGWTPMTVRQAAEAGIREAQQWLETGVEPYPPAYVRMPPFAPPPRFQRVVASAPLSIRLSLQSVVFTVDSDQPEQTKDKEERLQLISEILVLLFGKNAEEVAEELLHMHLGLAPREDDGVAFATGPPKVQRRYGKKPGPGWMPGGTSRLGIQIWIWGARSPSPGDTSSSSPPGQPSAPIPPVSPTTAPTQAPAPPTPIPTPPAPIAQPAQTVPLRVGGQLARAQSIAAHNAAMAKIVAGQQLTAADKASLARKLTNMPIGNLRTLHAALGGTARLANMKAAVAAVRTILTGGSQPQTPTPVQAPPAQATVPTPAPVAAVITHDDIFASTSAIVPADQNTIIRVANRILAGKAISQADYDELKLALTQTSLEEDAKLVKALGLSPSTNSLRKVLTVARARIGSAAQQPAAAAQAPSPTTRTVAAPIQSNAPTKKVDPNVPAETNWETGKPQPGTLNSVDFAPAPPKFWEKVRDVDIGEPPPAHGKKVDRVSVMIQEPDGRIWIVQPTNGFGNRKYTMPGGTVEPGLTNQQNALKEIWEETGLQVEITGHLGDFEDSNNGKNGRLYIGKRVGGAPWDAKIEPHIVSHKTGKPSAESEVVSLVTPDRASQLLHRTDDLAQLMTVHPMGLNTKVDGNTLKKFVDGIQPNVQKYIKEKTKSGHTAGNAELHVVQDLRGFNEKPNVVPKKDFDALVKQGNHIEVLRGLKTVHNGPTAAQLADQFRAGDHFPGHGIFGSGTYADSRKGPNNVANSYSGYGTSGAVIRIAIPKTAKIVKASDLKRTVSDKHGNKSAPSNFSGYASASGKSPRDCWMGVHAALAGYDVIQVDDAATSFNQEKSYYVILNRSIVTVQQEDATGHVIK